MRRLLLVSFGLMWASAVWSQPAPAPAPLSLKGPTAEENGTARLANLPGRPAWGPLPVLGGRTTCLPLVTQQALHAADARARGRALLLLGFVGSTKGVRALSQGLKDKDRENRIKAGVALCLCGQSKGIYAAREALTEGPEWLRYYAVYGLWLVGGPTAKTVLQRTRSHQSPFLQRCMGQAMTDLGPSHHVALPALAKPVEVPASVSQVWQDAADAFIRETDYWWHRGDYDQCIRCQETTIYYDPSRVDTYACIAWLQWSMGRNGQAIRTYHHAIAANPQTWQAYQELAMYYYFHHQRAAAVEYFADAAHLGSPAIPRRMYGHALEALGRDQEAIAVWHNILKLDPHDPIALRQLRRLHANAQQ